MIQLHPLIKFSATTIISSFLLASQGKALIVNGIFVGLLPVALKRKDFQSKLLIILGGALVSETLSYTLKGRLSVTPMGLISQTSLQIGFAYCFSPKKVL